MYVHTNVGKVQSAGKYIYYINTSGLVKTKTTRHLLRVVADVTFTCKAHAMREKTQAKQTHKTYKSSSRAQRSAANTSVYVCISICVCVCISPQCKRSCSTLVLRQDREACQTNRNKRNSLKASTTTKRIRREWQTEQLHINWRVCKI